MATTVVYQYEYPYRYTEKGNRYPLLQIRLANLTDSSNVLEVDAYLDSGTARSLFDGQLAQAIGLDLMAGQEESYSPTAGGSMWARIHRVGIEHPDLGRFQLEVGFSDIPIRRNLLGRDFFALVQVGFRERNSTFYLTNVP